jgi:pimeloyl-ACP methyl ester carboxylesterase
MMLYISYLTPFLTHLDLSFIKVLMKKIFLLLFGSAILNSLSAQTARRDTGIINGAAYEIQIPANWNKKLILYAHGYDAPSNPPNFQNPLNIAPVFLERGFAVARSAYRLRGWAFQEGIDDTEALRQHFVKKFGKTDSTFITGHSMGGGITIATLEKNPKIYNGAMALCPLSTPPYEQTKGAFDSYVIFNALFPDLLPKAADLMNPKFPATFSGNFPENMKKAQEIVAKIKDKDELIVAFLQMRQLKASDLAFSLVFSEGILRDLSAQVGGNPFDNTNTLYSGFPDNWDLNGKVERLTATASNERLIQNDRTGLIEKPLLMMHTTYDQLISSAYGIEKYDNLVHEKHKELNLKVLYTNGQGHCAFSPQQTAVAFDALRQWVTTGKKPSIMAVESPTMPVPPTQLDTICYEMRIYTAQKGKLNDLLKRFRNHTTKLFEKHGMTNVGYWTPLDNPDEKLYYVLSYPNRAARELAWKSFSADTAWQSVVKASEANGGLVAKAENIFLKATDFSPKHWKPSNNGVWQFRIYKTTANNLPLLLQRFREFTYKRFEYFGMTNQLYWTATDAAQGADKMLYYFLTQPSEPAANANFAKFVKDPAWIATRNASEVKGGGSLTEKVESVFMFPTDFSPIR